MKKSILLTITFLAITAQLVARDLYIYNDTTEKISVKGPMQMNNKGVVIPSEIEPGKILIKNLDIISLGNDTINLVYGGVASGNFKKLSRKFTRPVTFFKINWDTPQIFEIQSETQLNNETSF